MIAWVRLTPVITSSLAWLTETGAPLNVVPLIPMSSAVFVASTGLPVANPLASKKARLMVPVGEVSDVLIVVMPVVQGS